ncbi:hypothetical protein HAX54_048429 [Datura stramonium]|uniref:Uncharacterized protein n=1 Tax=Datura stramonium TaxID=4076 RepID=A0ABS8RIU3_DATST|nr:hypothetical protein [Datura stramonium]
MRKIRISSLKLAVNTWNKELRLKLENSRLKKMNSLALPLRALILDSTLEWDEQKEASSDAQNNFIEEIDKEVNKGDTNLKIDIDQSVMIDQKCHKEINNDDDDVYKQENGVEIQTNDINFLDSKSDDKVIKKKEKLLLPSLLMSHS